MPSEGTRKESVMAWLAATIVILLLIYSGRFRKVAVALAAVLAVSVVVIYLYMQDSKIQTRSLIAESDLDFQDITLQPDYTGYKITGRIKNNSRQYTMTAVGLNISFDDCDTNTSNENCVTIGESKDRVSLLIPAGQLREISEHVYPGSTHPKGRLVWHYSVSYIEGK